MSEKNPYFWEREKVEDLDRAETILREVFHEDERLVYLFRWALDKARRYKGHDYYTVNGNIFHSGEWNREIGAYDFEVLLGEYTSDKKLSQGNWIDEYSLNITKSLHYADLDLLERIPGIRFVDFKGSPTYLFYIAEEIKPLIEKIVEDYRSDELILTSKIMDEDIEKEKFECLLRCVHEKGWKHVLDVLYDAEGGACDD